MRPIAALIFAAFLSACASSGGSREYTPASAPRTVWIVGGSGQAIGQATFTDGPHGVLIRLEFSAGALAPGWHGLHLHQRGDCSDFAAGFQASGAHARMEHHGEHGLLNPDGPEAGDLPNIFAAPAGPFAAEVFTPYVTLGNERIPGNANRQAREPLLDGDGSALLIHAAPDDHASQPIGGAGARIACAALTRLP
jgi:superoxide dismutase, Cu-Zn family